MVSLSARSSPPGGGSWRRLLAAPVMTASGVRRSWDTERLRNTLLSSVSHDLRRAQVVGHRAEERVAKPLGLRGQARLLRLARQARAVEAHRDLVGQRLE